MQNYNVKEDIRTYWSKRAPVFDADPAHKIEDTYGMPEWQALLRKVLALKTGQNLSDTKALDVACGTGEISRVLCAMGAEVTGVDFSEPMLEIARSKLEGHSWQAIHADAEGLFGVMDNSYDLVVTRHLCWTLTEPASAYANWLRVLKPGGTLIVFDGNWVKAPGWKRWIAVWLANRLEPAPDRPSVDGVSYDDIFAQIPYRDGLTAESLCQDLETAGFVGLSEVPLNHLYRRAMRAYGLAERLRQIHENRFGVVCQKPSDPTAP